jgi:hypothetical protein
VRARDEWRELERDWPQVECLDGKTGQTLAAEWLAKNEIQRELALDLPWPTGLVEFERLPPVAGTPPGQRSFEIPIAGERTPFFSDTNLNVSSRWQDFFARDSYGRQFWKVTLDGPAQPTNPQFNRAYACGHFVLISVGAQVLAIDTLGTAEQPGARLLWKTSLSAPGRIGNIPPRLPAVNPQRADTPNDPDYDYAETDDPDSTLNGGITLARSGTCDLASTAPGRTAFEKSPPSSCSSASHEAPQKPSLSSPVRRLVPPGQSAAAWPTGLSPPIGS